MDVEVESGIGIGIGIGIEIGTGTVARSGVLSARLPACPSALVHWLTV